MALNQKYTWADFLKEHPEKKGLKRTSSEGKKAFESAFKAKMKKYLTERSEKVKKSQEKAAEKRGLLMEKVKSFKKAKNLAKAKCYQEQVGRQDAWIARLSKQSARIKVLQKSF